MTTKLEQALDAIREAKAELEKQEPIGMIIGGRLESLVDEYETGAWPIYAAPVRTKDLTDEEIVEALGYDKSYRLKRWVLDDARAVIAADREKNK